MKILNESLSDLPITPLLHDLLLSGGIRKLSDLSPLNLSSFVRLFKGRLRSCGELHALLKANHIGLQFHSMKDEARLAEIERAVGDINDRLERLERIEGKLK